MNDGNNSLDQPKTMEKNEYPHLEGQEVTKGKVLEDASGVDIDQEGRPHAKTVKNAKSSMLSGGERVKKGGGREAMERWIGSDPFVPGISYVWIYSVGAILAIISPDMAMFVVLAYILIAVGANIGYYYNKNN